jgi:hypothetical protein
LVLDDEIRDDARGGDDDHLQPFAYSPYCSARGRAYHRRTGEGVDRLQRGGESESVVFTRLAHAVWLFFWAVGQATSEAFFSCTAQPVAFVSAGLQNGLATEAGTR